MTGISHRNIIRTYRFYAPFYDQVFGPVFDPGRRALTDAVSSLRPRSVLEVGVGTGLTLDHYPATTRVVGIDLSSAMLSVAQRKIGQMDRSDVQLVAMDAENMAFPDGAFDCVTLPYVLSVTPNPTRFVQEIRRVCRKGGTIFILNHFSGSRFWWLLERTVQPMAGKIGFRSDFSYAEQILKHDWEVRSVREVNFLGLSKLVEIRNR